MPWNLNATSGGGGIKLLTPYTQVDPDVASRSGMDYVNQQQQIKSQKQLQDAQLAAQRYGVDVNAGVQREGYANQARIAQMQSDASKYPYLLKQQRWEQIWPFAQNLLAGGPGSWMSGYRGQGQVGQQPTISDAPIYSQMDIQNQVNATRAQNDAALASRQAQLSKDMAGKGYGSRSPLAMALNNAMFGQNLAGNTAAEQQLRWNAAQGNAQQVLEAQKAREGQFASRQNEEIERNKVQSGILSQLLGGIFSAV
jgi:hypothetical protein